MIAFRGLLGEGARAPTALRHVYANEPEPPRDLMLYVLKRPLLLREITYFFITHVSPARGPRASREPRFIEPPEPPASTPLYRLQKIVSNRSRLHALSRLRFK